MYTGKLAFKLREAAILRLRLEEPLKCLWGIPSRKFWRIDSGLKVGFGLSLLRLLFPANLLLLLLYF